LLAFRRNPPRKLSTGEKLMGVKSYASVLSQLYATASSELEHPISEKIVLKGSVAHSTQLQPVSSMLRSGATLDFGKLKMLNPENDWYRIPSWRAGEWTTTKHTVTSRLDYPTKTFSEKPVESDVIEVANFGFQLDNHGDIWDFDGRSTSIEDPNIACYDVNRHTEVIDADENKLITKVTCTRTIADKLHRQIKQTQQLESITVNLRDGKDGLVSSQSQKIFDEDGRAWGIANLVVKRRKSKPFQVISNFQGKDLKALFKEYLARTNQENLVPK
jgi:hypothetical protein